MDEERSARCRSGHRSTHTWNIGKYADYEGVSWYFRTFLRPAGPRVELHFGATFYKARVWYETAWRPGRTRAAIRSGGWKRHRTCVPNLIAVEIDDRPGSPTIPGYAMSLRGGDNVWYDWWHYGGIVRDVWLAVTEPLPNPTAACAKRAQRRDSRHHGSGVY